MPNSFGRVLRGTLLISGTTIGGGVLGLPVLTSLGGFVPAMVMFFLCWAFMTATGLLALEAYMWQKGDPNLVTMSENTLGRPGKIFTWAIYIFFFYCLSVAYTLGCGKLVVAVSGGTLPSEWGPIVFTALFAPLVYAGAKVIGRLNVFLMVGLIGFYFIFVFLGVPYVNTENLEHTNWLMSLKAMPIAFASFGFHGIVPTLGRYLNKNLRDCRIAIIVGSLIPLIAYITWDWLILGIVPLEGEGGLREALALGNTAVEPLKQVLNNPNIYIVGQCFAFFALVTSFLGVTLGLRDFLADGLGIEKDAKGRIAACVMIFVPVLMISATYPHIFLVALDYAGGFGASLLLGLLPILMVWSGRYHLHLPKQESALPGGRFLLSILICFVAVELITETLQLFQKI